jgi:uncharacterized protein (TIGR03437 family)
MSAGTYNANVTILASASNSPVTIPVIFTVTPAQKNPSIGSGGIVSAAGSNPGIARGSIASLYGTALADASATATTVPLPRTLGNVQVSVNGVSAPLWYVDSQQINFQVPFEAPLQGQASVVVTRDGVASSPMTVALTPYAPSIFTYQRVTGVFDPVIVHATDNQLVTPSDPAVAGEYVVVYGTGIGDLTVALATDTLSPTSPPATARVTPTATIGGVNAPVGFAGLTPGLIGLAQFNVQVPNNLPSGSALPLVINFNGAASSPVNLAVQSGKPTANLNLVFAPNPVNESSDGSWSYSLQVLETNGVGVKLTKLVAGGTDISGSISAFFGSDRIPANGQLNDNFRTPCGTPCTPPYDYSWQFTGNDDNGHTGLTWTGTVRLLPPQSGGISGYIIKTVAGNGSQGYAGDGGPATSAELHFPEGIALDKAGNLYISDVLNNRIRRIDSNGTVATVAGNGTAGYSGDGGLANTAKLNDPLDVVADLTGNLFIADAFNYRIRKVTPAGTITTFAGNGSTGSSGDGGSAANALLNLPEGVALDSTGNVFIAESLGNRIRKVAVDGTITTVAGNGVGGYSGDGGPAVNAQLNSPKGVAVDATGALYIADRNNWRIRKVAPNGTITTVAGTGVSGYSGDGGPAANAQLFVVQAVAVDASGNIFISDETRLRRVTPDGTITTVAGNGTLGYSGDGGPATSAQINGCEGIAVDTSGNIYFADYFNNVIRMLVPVISPAGGASGVDSYTGMQAGRTDITPVPQSVVH